MDHSSTLVHANHETGGGTKEIIRVTIILTVLTIVELALGFLMMKMPDNFLHHFIKGVILILMVAKAFYIVGYFMHLKHEIRNLIMTIIVPLMLFVWFIIAFLADGNSYKNLRNTYDKHYKEKSTEQAPKHEEEHKEASPTER